MEVENKRNGSEKFEYSLKSSKIPSETKIYSSENVVFFFYKNLMTSVDFKVL